RLERPLKRRGRDWAGAQGRSRLRIEPARFEAEQGAAVQEALVRVARGQDAVSGPLRAEKVREVQHGLDALGAAPGAVKAVPRAEELRGVLLAFEDDALRAGEVVRAGDLGDVEGLAAELPAALVAGHVEAQQDALAVAPHEGADGRAHSSSPSSDAAWSMMAHSIRFLKRRQP